MNSKRLAILYVAILTTMILGTALVLSKAAVVVGANITWEPKNFTWTDSNFPEKWYAEIALKGGHKAQYEINHTTIRLSGLYPDTGYSPIYDQIKNATHGPRLIVPFVGSDVGSALAASGQIPDHMGIFLPGTYRVQLEITGYLKPEYGGDLFRGDGVIVVTIP